nr:hypothetical protein Iba_chr03bCG7070 [Ipomoea batatas]
MDIENHSDHLNLLLFLLGLNGFLRRLFGLVGGRRRRRNGRDELHLTVALLLHPRHHLERICLLPLHHHLVALAIRHHIFNSFEAFKAPANFPSTPLAMHVHFKHNLLRRRRWRWRVFRFLRRRLRFLVTAAVFSRRWPLQEIYNLLSVILYLPHRDIVKK